MRKVLIIHHLEEMWDKGFKNNGTSFQREAERVLEHLQEEEYDQVILTRYSENSLGDEHHDSGLAEYITTVEQYDYGWEKGTIDGEEGEEWAEGGGHSEIVLLTGWMRSLKGCEVYLCGAFDGECIEDIQLALEAVGVSYRRLNELII